MDRRCYSSRFVPGWFIWLAPQRFAFQTFVSNGRSVQQQRCSQNECSEVFPGWNHINKKVPAQFAQSPLPIESFLHLQTWHTRYPSSGQAYALEFNISFAGVKSIAFNVATLCQQRWNTNVNWNQMIADFDLVNMHGHRQDLETTLQAMGLDHNKLPKKCDPGYRHTAATEEVAQRAHEQHTQALVSGQAPPNIGSQASSSPAPPQSSSAFSQQPQSRETAAPPATSTTQPLMNEGGTAYQLPATPPHLEFMTATPVSRQAARDAFLAMQHNALGYTMGDWYVWYISLEIGKQLFASKFTWVKAPRDDLVKAMCDIPMDSSELSPQTWSRTRATRLFPLHLPRLRMSVSQSFGSLQEAQTFHRMQFATQRMALLQDSLHLIQAGFGSS